MVATEEIEPSLTSAVAAYLPGALVEWLRSAGSLTPGETTQFNAVALVAQFTGLTSLVEQLSHMGAPGLEAIDEHVNAILGELITRVQDYGGVVASLDGEALVAYLPQTPDLFVTKLARRALSCALEMKGPAESWDHGGQPRFGVRIGLAYGPIAAVTVGDEGGWQAFVIGGPSLDWAAVCAHHADRGQVVAAANIVAPLREDVTGDRLAGQRYLVRKLENRAEPDPHPPEPEWPPRLINLMLPFTPPVLANQLLETGQAEVRRGQVTCMYIDFRGPDFNGTGAGEELQAYIRPMAAVILRYSGHIDSIQIDDEYCQVCVFFGISDKVQDNERRAMACALALQRVALVADREQRIGVARGYVFIGPLGDVTRRRYAVVGQVVEQARQLAGWAQLGHTLADAGVYIHTQQEFAFQLVEAAQELYRLEGEQPTIGALAARYLRTDQPIAGRNAALDAIASTIESVKGGRGRVLVLSGPAGIGKRRLTEATVKRWLNAGGNGYGTIIRPDDTYNPLEPWIAVLRSIFGLTNGSDSLTLHDKFLAQIRSTCQTPDRAAGLLGPLVGIDVMPSKDLAVLDARAWREGVFEVCADLIAGLARRQPMIFVFENLHLADASTLALFEYLAPAIAEHRVLFCLTTESVTPQLGFFNLPHTVHVNLSPLTGAEAWALTEHLAPAVDWPPHVRTRLDRLWGAANSDEPGRRPLFVEETLHLLAQAEMLEYGNGSYHLADVDATVDIPGALDTLLEARIELLDAPAQTLLQTAAALGATFDQSTLEAIYPGSMPGTALRDWLNTLIAARLIVMDEDSDPLARQICFRHVCIRTAALERLTADRLRTIFVRLADYLVVQRELGTVDVDDAVLAHYYNQGGVHDKAVDCALRAAIDAQQLYANAEALYHYQIAKRHVDALPDTASQWPLYLQIYLNQADIYLEMDDLAAAEANASRALRLSAEHHAHRLQAQATNLLGKIALRRSRGEEAMRFAGEAIRLSEAANFETELVVARRLLGCAYLQLGRPAEAWEPLWRGVELARKLGDPVMIAKTVATLGVMYARNYRMMDAVLSLNEALDLIRPSGDRIRLADNLDQLGCAYLRRGEGDKALDAYEEAVAIFRQLNIPLRLGSVLKSLGAALCFTGRYQQAAHCFDEAAGLFEQHNAQRDVMECVGARARELERDLGQHASAQAHLEAALEVMDDVGGSFEAIVEFKLALADVCVELGRLSDAEEALRGVRTHIEREKARWFWPEFHLIAGYLAMAQNDHHAALESAYQGLAAISSRGDPRPLSKIYLLLSRALRVVKPHDESPVCDALERSMQASRNRARRLDRALALNEFGAYLQKQAGSKFTSRARGSGFLYEAEFIFKEIGFQRPGTNGSSTP